MEQSNLNVGWMGWDGIGMGYLQTGPFLDHLAVIKKNRLTGIVKRSATEKCKQGGKRLELKVTGG